MIAYRVATLNYKLYVGSHIDVLQVDHFGSTIVAFTPANDVEYEPICTDLYRWCKDKAELAEFIKTTIDIEAKALRLRLQQLDKILTVYGGSKWLDDVSAQEASVPIAASPDNLH